MRAVAAWLTARPWNSTLGLALIAVAGPIVPLAPLFGGAVMVMLVLAQGIRRAVLSAGGALLVLTLLSLVSGTSALLIVMDALIAWVPGALLAMLMLRSCSLTLALQVSVIVAALLTMGFHVVYDDPTAFWREVLTQWASMYTELGLTQWSAFLTEHGEALAPQMTMIFVLVRWSAVALVMLLGYSLYRSVPGQSAQYGRFCDVNFGRVLATIMAAASMLALVIKSAALQNLAFILFAVFWVQGMAVLHWLRNDGPVPTAALVVVYVLMPVLNIVLLIPLAVLGYTDAWFNYRPRIAAAKRRK